MQRESIEEAVRAVVAYDYGQSTSAWFKIDRLINDSHGDEQARSWIESELASRLDADITLAAKQEICRRLWRMGSDQSLDSLRPLLEADDPREVSAACYAIGRRPSTRADDFLRAALRKAPPECKAPLEHLIEDRR